MERWAGANFSRAWLLADCSTLILSAPKTWARGGMGFWSVTADWGVSKYGLGSLWFGLAVSDEASGSVRSCSWIWKGYPGQR